MDSGYITVFGLLAIGIAYGVLRKKPAREKKSNSGWAVALVLGIPIGGLILASAIGNETLTWIFGLSLMLVLPLLLFFAIGASIGSLFKRDKNEKE